MLCVPPTNLTLLPVGFASNLHYFYDLYPVVQNLEPETMPFPILERAITQFFAYTNHSSKTNPFKIFWQGGEPALAGLDYFKEAAQLIEQTAQNQKVEQFFYTNGTLLTPEWAELFEAHHITPVLYLIGPKELYTRDPDDRFFKIEQGIEILLRRKIHFHTCTPIIRTSCDIGEAVYEFAARYAFHMNFYPLTPAFVQELHLPAQYMEDTVTPQGYADFFSQLFDTWEIRGRKFKHVQQFDAIMRRLDKKPIGLCSSDTLCSGNTVLDVRGNLYPCRRAMSEAECLGNLTQAPLAELWASCEKFAQQKTSALPEKCLRCSYSQWCLCGCPKDRTIFEKANAPAQNYLCAGYYGFLNKVLSTDG